MPTHYFKITTPMVCGGCTSTVERALLAVPGVSGVSVSLESQAAQVHTTKDDVACQCTVCNCGPKCECMTKSLVKALSAVGFDSTIATAADFTCGSSSGTTGTTAKPPPCGHAKCTCGANCQCGRTCQCAGCPGNASSYGGSSQNWKSRAWAYATPTNFAVSAALIGIGWMAAIKFAK
jgi:copper chaperone CopZ